MPPSNLKEGSTNLDISQRHHDARGLGGGGFNVRSGVEEGFNDGSSVAGGGFDVGIRREDLLGRLDKVYRRIVDVLQNLSFMLLEGLQSQ